MSEYKSHQFVRFLCVGVINTIVGLATIYIAKWYFLFGDVSANATGYAFGLLTSFTLNSRWTFSYCGPRLPAILKFCLATALAYVMNLATVLVAINYLDLNTYFSQALGIPAFTITNYILSKYLVFRTAPKSCCTID